jgi:hypothetical protein
MARAPQAAWTSTSRWGHRGRILPPLCLAALATAHAHAEPLPALLPERSAEDWRGSSAPLKDIRLGGDAHLTLGADARFKIEGIDAPRLGFSHAIRDVWLTQRYLAHADLRAGDHLRVFAQLGVHDGRGRKADVTFDDDRFDLNQGFVDLGADVGEARASLRLGRQELTLGSPRFVTLRDPTNLRQRYDLARLMVVSKGWRADAFAGRPTQDRVGVVDDRGDPRQEFAGLRVQRRYGPLTANLLVFELTRDGFLVGEVAARDHRRSVGGHVFGRFGVWDIDAEALRQTGRFGAQRVSAFGGAVDVGRTFRDARLSPRLGARVTYGSGDRDPADGEQGTFAPPFPGAWFGQNGLSSFSNVVEAAATLRLEPRRDLAMSFKLGGSWRADTHDYVYIGNAVALPGTRGGAAEVAASASAAMIWRLSRHVTWTGYVSAVAISDDLKALGGDDVIYANSALSFSY